MSISGRVLAFERFRIAVIESITSEDFAVLQFGLVQQNSERSLPPVAGGVLWPPRLWREMM